jgi:uncharacterized protein (DUF1800 family)
MFESAIVATNRFGLGARNNELQQALKQPKQWLKNQLTPIEFDQSLPNSAEIALKLTEYRQQKKMAKTGKDETFSKQLKNFPKHAYTVLSFDTLNRAINSNQSLMWRLLDFFSNHFSVTAQGPVMTALAPTLEREAIAPHLLGSFEQMLLAVIHHPAMLIYLNNEKSFGNNSALGKKRKKGLNENLAREIMELHTLGVNGGYSQADVIELAKGITGWSVANPTKDKTTGFKYRANGHEPGNRQLLGKTFTQKGALQGVAMLKMLAQHPNTAKHLCFKLAQHVVSDTPSKALVAQLTTAWLNSGGNLKAVYIALIEAQESWQTSAQKYKTPREFVISALRLTWHKPLKAKQVLFSLKALGQQPFKAGSPAGYSDEQDDWNGASALMARIDWAMMLANLTQGSAKQLIEQAFADQLTQTSAQAILRAESQKQALALLLMSPEFLRR